MNSVVEFEGLKMNIIDASDSHLMEAITDVQERLGITVVDYVAGVVPKTHQRYIRYVAAAISRDLKSLDNFSVNIDGLTVVDRVWLTEAYSPEKVNEVFYRQLLRRTEV